MRFGRGNTQHSPADVIADDAHGGRIAIAAHLAVAAAALGYVGAWNAVEQRWQQRWCFTADAIVRAARRQARRSCAAEAV